MAYKIDTIEGIGPVLAEKFTTAGISTVEELLEKGATPKGRTELAETTGIGAGQILKFVNHADLFRIKGIAGQMAELLEASGVDTVKELRNRNAANLAEKCKEVNEAKNLVNSVPSEKELQDMIDQAKELPPVVTY